jgi:hypothetical protein
MTGDALSEHMESARHESGTDEVIGNYICSWLHADLFRRVKNNILMFQKV